VEAARHIELRYGALRYRARVIGDVSILKLRGISSFEMAQSGTDAMSMRKGLLTLGAAPVERQAPTTNGGGTTGVDSRAPCLMWVKPVRVEGRPAAT
jgi:hypothetical protein